MTSTITNEPSHPMTRTCDPRISAAILTDSTVKPSINTRSRHATCAESNSSMTDDSSSLDARFGNPIANEINPEMSATSVTELAAPSIRPNEPRTAASVAALATFGLAS